MHVSVWYWPVCWCTDTDPRAFFFARFTRVCSQMCHCLPNVWERVSSGRNLSSIYIQRVTRCWARGSIHLWLTLKPLPKYDTKCSSLIHQAWLTCKNRKNTYVFHSTYRILFRNLWTPTKHICTNRQIGNRY